MNGFGRAERSALDAVARRFGATWHEEGDGADAYLAVGRRQVAVEVAAIRPRFARRSRIAKPRLRYDRVALRFLRDFRDSAREVLARGDTAILSIRAPILQSRKTADALRDRFRAYRERVAKKAEFETRISGNRINVRIVRGDPAGNAGAVGFVISASVSPKIVLDAAHALRERLLAAEGRHVGAGIDGGRWLVLLGETPLGETYRDACAQLPKPAGIAKVLLVTEDSRVDVIAE